VALRSGFTVQEKKEERNTFVRLPVREKKIASNKDAANTGLSTEIDWQIPCGKGTEQRDLRVKTGVENVSFFIDKECITGYGPLTESLFTLLHVVTIALPRKPLLVLRVGNTGAGRTVYLLETYLIYLSKGGIDNAEA